MKSNINNSNEIFQSKKIIIHDNSIIIDLSDITCTGERKNSFKQLWF